MMHFTPKYKPEIVSDIASYIYPDISDRAGVLELIDRIKQHISILRSLEVLGIFISFKYVRKLDKKSLEILIQELSEFSAKNLIPVGFGEYSHSFFPTLLELTKQTNIALYKRINVMALSLGTRAPFSTVLVYLEDENEANMIASHLISNQYSVIISPSKEDLKKRLAGNRKAYDHVVIDSHFGHIQDKVLIRFKHHMFHYTFYGRLDKTLDQSLHTGNFQEHLDFGYRVFIFDLSNIQHIDINAAHLMIKFLDKAQHYHAAICLIGLHEDTYNSNAFAILKRSGFWNYDDLNDLYEDPEVINKLKEQTLSNNPLGISKKIIEIIPIFLKSTKNVLSLLGLKNIDVTTQQCHVNEEPKIYPYISTHIRFEGDYVGEMNFIFPKESVEAILQRKYDHNSALTKEDHIDALKEFSSTIMDKLNEQLETKGLSIECEFPVATEGDKVDLSCSEHRYILETFHCDRAPFYVTITDFVPEEHLELLSS